MIVGIAVDTTVDSNDERAVTRSRAIVTARRRAGSKRGAAEADIDRREYQRLRALESRSGGADGNQGPGRSHHGCRARHRPRAGSRPVSYTHLRAHETVLDLV